MNTSERIEMLDLQIEAIYRTYFETFGAVRVPESRSLSLLWGELELLLGKVA